jgi:hypothetical protein
MHELSTRAMRRSRQKGAIIAALLTAIFHSGMGLAAASPAAAPTGSRPQIGHAAHQIAITQVKDGKERLTLQARLAEGTAVINRGIDWTIRDASGAILLQEAAPAADAALPPGDYAVEAAYGTVVMKQAVTLPPQTELEVTFVLDVGGLRILPLLGGTGIPEGLAESRIYVTSGRAAGQLVAVSTLPGEVLRVAAGSYRIESRFRSGNAVAVTDVVVRPGVMSAVNIDHVAGLARLSYANANTADIFWQVVDDAGRLIAEFDGAGASLALKPGGYTAQAKIGGQLRSAHFAVAAGERYDIAISR